MKSCVKEEKTLNQLNEATTKAHKYINGGVPRFVFDKFTYDGFLGNWDTTNDYEQVKILMDAGLTTK
jgi:hypothetical protein